MKKMIFGELNAEQYLLAFIKWATELSPEEQEVWDNLQQKNKEKQKAEKKQEKELKRKQYRERVRTNREKRLMKKIEFKIPNLNSLNFNTIIKDPLSAKENEILSDLKEGLTPQEIAAKRFISITTVKTHINNIYTKKQVHNMQQLLVKEFRNEQQNKLSNVMQGLKILNMKL